MAVVHFITHAEVEIDPAVPVPDWRLSPIGLRRATALTQRPWVRLVRSVFSSAERKAVEVADLLGLELGIIPVIRADLGENDRSATGYLPRAEFEAVADEFFARPEHSVRGWERAVDAQRRIVVAVGEVLAMAPEGDVAVVAHGGVGALLLCHLLGLPISREQDQPGQGGGNVFRFDTRSRRVIQGWRPIEDA